MKTRPIAIIELPAFLSMAEAIWTDAERAESIDYVARNPESGDLIPEPVVSDNCDGGERISANAEAHALSISTTERMFRFICCWPMQRR